MSKEKPEHSSNGKLTIFAGAKLKNLDVDENYLKELQNEPNLIALAQFVWQWH